MNKAKPSRLRVPSAGPRILAALTELTESLERGQALPPGASARGVESPGEPGAYDPSRIRAAREKLGASREEFAGMLGVSSAMVQSLELGRRAPSRLVRRMLDEFGREPERWRRVADARAASARAAALATLDELREQFTALMAEREGNRRRSIEGQLDALREAILDSHASGGT